MAQAYFAHYQYALYCVRFNKTLIASHHLSEPGRPSYSPHACAHYYGCGLEVYTKTHTLTHALIIISFRFSCGNTRTSVCVRVTERTTTTTTIITWRVRCGGHVNWSDQTNYRPGVRGVGSLTWDRMQCRQYADRSSETHRYTHIYIHIHILIHSHEMEKLINFNFSMLTTFFVAIWCKTISANARVV